MWIKTKHYNELRNEILRQSRNIKELKNWVELYEGKINRLKGLIPSRNEKGKFIKK